MPTKTFQEKILREQLLFIPISLFTAYIIASLRITDEVKYFPLTEVSGKVFILASILAIIIYGAITAVLRTKARLFIKELFKIFDLDKKFDFVYLLSALFFFITIFIITYNSAPWGDYLVHANTAVHFNWRNLRDSMSEIPYPLWHISVNLLNRVFFVPIRYAVAIATALLYTADYCVIRNLAVVYNREIAASKIKRIDLLVLSLMYVGPIYIHAFSESMFAGQGSPNVLHNPTIICSYALALICVYLFVRMLEKLRKNEKITTIDYIRSGIFLFFSVFAKPSFIQIFAPAVAAAFVIMLIKTKGKSFQFELKYFLSCIPAGLYCIIIFVITVLCQEDSEGGGVAIGFFTVWSTSSKCIPVSVMLALGFPIAYILAQRKNIINKIPYCISLLCLLFGFLEYALLYETGRRMHHGNFGWGYLTGMTLIFAFTMVDWIKPLFEKKKTMIIPFVIYILHLVCGFTYYLGFIFV